MRKTLFGGRIELYINSEDFLSEWILTGVAIRNWFIGIARIF